MSRIKIQSIPMLDSKIIHVSDFHGSSYYEQERYLCCKSNVNKHTWNILRLVTTFGKHYQNKRGSQHNLISTRSLNRFHKLKRQHARVHNFIWLPVKSECIIELIRLRCSHTRKLPREISNRIRPPFGTSMPTATIPKPHLNKFENEPTRPQKRKEAKTRD